MSKKIAVVILNWNGSAMMRRFLPSVVKGSSEEAEVVVADNGSTDDSCAMLQEEFPEVRLIRFSKNYGFAEGYNRALAQVDARYYLLLNSDVEVEEGWLRPMLAFMEAHDDVCACQPKLLSFAHRDEFEYAGAAGGYIDRLGYPFCRGRVFGTVEKDEGQYDSVADILWASGAALMIRSAAWRKAGGLDGRFFAHQEEIDLCWRLRNMGQRIVCVPESRVWHVGGASLAQGNPRKTFLNFRNNLAMLFKNLPEEDLRPVLRLRYWLDRLAALQFFLKGDAANARAVFKGRRAFKKWRKELTEDRKKIQAESKSADIVGRTGFSLLWQYYGRGRKTFSALRGGGRET